MKKQLWAIAALALAASAGSAFAADAYVDAPTSWSGFYGGVQLGYANSSNSRFYDGEDYYCDGCWYDAQGGGTGYTLGASLGYDWQFSDVLVAGIVANVTGVFDETIEGEIYDDSYIFQGADLNALGSINGRLGFLASESALIYATGGLAMANVTGHHWDSSEYDNTDRNFSGWNFGGGVEWKATEHVSLQLEGRYYSLGSKRWEDQSEEPFGFEPRIWTASVGVNYRF